MTPREEFEWSLQALIMLAVKDYKKNKEKTVSDKKFNHETHDLLVNHFTKIMNKWAPQDVLEKEEKHDTCKECDGSCDGFVVLCHSLNCHSPPIGVFYTEEKALERIQYLKKSCPEVFADASFSIVRTWIFK